MLQAQHRVQFSARHGSRYALPGKAPRGGQIDRLQPEAPSTTYHRLAPGFADGGQWQGEELTGSNRYHALRSRRIRSCYQTLLNYTGNVLHDLRPLRSRGDPRRAL